MGRIRHAPREIGSFEGRSEDCDSVMHMRNSSSKTGLELSALRLGVFCRALLLVLLIAGIAGERGGVAFAASSAPETGRLGMVVSTHHAAAKAGARILREGGNAIDAAVATAFAVGVAQPFSAGVGGGMFALVRLEDGEILALDARETAPAAATWWRPGSTTC